MRTTRPGTDAAGGVTGLDQFVHMAAHGAKIAARNALNGDALAYDNRVMQAVVFTDPQVASVGWTQESARDAGYAVKTSVLHLDQVPRALAHSYTSGLIKPGSDTVGNSLVGPPARTS